MIKPDSASALMCQYQILLAEGGYRGSCDTLEKAYAVAAQYPGAKVIDATNPKVVGVSVWGRCWPMKEQAYA